MAVRVSMTMACLPDCGLDLPPLPAVAGYMETDRIAVEMNKRSLRCII